MKTKSLLVVLTLVLFSQIKAQDFGRITVKNASGHYPRFIAGLNSVISSNEYTSEVSFKYLDDYSYKLKVLPAGSTNWVYFTVASEPKYISKYILNRDNVGNYSIQLESKSLSMGDPDPTNTVVVISTPQEMNTADYKNLTDKIQKESMANTKLEIAKTFLNKQLLSSKQVYSVTKLFPFESKRLDFAKFAYSRTIDKQNYFVVFDAFEFSSSKQEMTEYIKNNP